MKNANGQLDIVNTSNAGTPITEAGVVPLLTVDLWEHAYFTEYQGNKEQYCENFLASVDWGKVSANFEAFNLDNKVAPIVE